MGEIHDVGDTYLDEGLCALCGKPTVREGKDSVDRARGEEEPHVCNRCLVDLRGEMATELEVRRQLTTLEAKIERVEAKLDTRLWFMSMAFTVALSVATLVIGVLLGIVLAD